MNDSLNRADAEIQQRVTTLSELHKKNAQLESDKIQSQGDSQSKSEEINALQGKVSNLTDNVEKEIKLRQDVLTGKEGVESMLQKKLDDMTNEMDTLRADANKNSAS